ncbi:MAG: hypothetical protein AB8B86_06470 [Pseudomonadales bacterium]
MSQLSSKILIAALLLATLPNAGLADELSGQSKSSGVEHTEFSAAFFSKFAPRTAKEMIDLVPGFFARELDNVRGLGQASSNVLINGARVSGKRDSALTVLGRVPASSVRMIVIRDGASLGIPGLNGDVADVIIDEQAFTGTWLWRTHQRARIDPVWYRFDLSLSGKHNSLTWKANLNNRQDRYGHWGLERVTDSVGVITEERNEFATYNSDKPGGSVLLSWHPPTGNIGNLSLSYERQRKDDDENSFRRLLSTEPPRNRFLDIDLPKRVGELSADYEFDAGQGRLKLIAYQRIENESLSDVTVVRSLLDAELNKQQFLRDSDIGETILRGEYSWLTKELASWQLTLEGVYNFVDAESRLLQSENGSPLLESTLNNGSSKVEEYRFESMLTYGRTISAVNFQLSLGGEFSQIQQSGLLGLSREFTRPKGFLSASKAFGSETTVSAKLSREVGQLDFFDFISSVNLDEQNSAAGNPQLVPPQTWQLELKLEQGFGAHGNLSWRFWGESIDDIVEYIPTANGEEAVGNLDKATRYGTQWVSTSYLDALGWSGAQVTIDLSLQRSVLDDPLTNQQRRINGDTISYLFVELRHDIEATEWAWGLNHRILNKSDTYRRKQILHVAQTRGELRLFIEHKNVFGLKATFLARNLIADTDQLTRSVFTGSREGELEFVEDRDRAYGTVFEFQIEGSF